MDLRIRFEGNLASLAFVCRVLLGFCAVCVALLGNVEVGHYFCSVGLLVIYIYFFLFTHGHEVIDTRKW